MTVSFPLDNERDLDRLMMHLSQFRLSAPGNCAISVQKNIAVVASQLNRELGTAKTAW
jgi:hypothetical protein